MSDTPKPPADDRTIIAPGTGGGDDPFAAPATPPFDTTPPELAPGFGIDAAAPAEAPIDDGRTIIAPEAVRGDAMPPATPAPPADDGRTIIAPDAGAFPAAPSAAPPAAAPPLDWATPPAPTPAPPPPPPRASQGQLRVGDVLNSSYEVKRFIARGGMGEVYEGINIHTDERVAIKAMLPALAADPNIQKLFRNEAATLTRLTHPALVRYRGLTKEPQLDVFYIATDFIDGVNLEDALGKIQPTPAELLALIRRLAGGLAAAHEQGAIHRDLSPDNIILENGKLEQARIIDFGIAKSLDPGAKTVIGDGFAGKLGYVAPEQLGDYDRQVGPWSDVYSLGLVMLAVIGGRHVDMGGSYVEAIDKRRKGPDLSGVPAEVRPVLEAMLQPDPAQRPRSMEAVIAATLPKAAPPPEVQATGGNRGLMIGGGVALLALVGGGIWLATAGGPATPPAAAVDPAVAATAALDKGLSGVACAWLDVVKLEKRGDGVAIGLAGVAGRPAAAQAAVARTVSAASVAVADIDASGVAPIEPTECNSIDAFRSIRAPAGVSHIRTAQRDYEMVLQNEGKFAGKAAAPAVIELDVGDLPSFALYGITPAGEIESVVAGNRETLAGLANGKQLIDLGNGRFRLIITVDHTGWSGLLLLTGDGGYDDAAIAAGPGVRSGAWRRQFETAASKGSWRSEMVWFRSVDAAPNG